MKRNRLIAVYILMCLLTLFIIQITALPSFAQENDIIVDAAPLFSDVLWILPVAVLSGVLIVLLRRRRR